MANITNTRAPTSHIAPFGVRMQPELKERLEKAAQESGRSLNAEIVARLEASFEGGSELSDFDKNFLLGLVSALKQTRETAGPQLDLFIQQPDGTTAMLDVKKVPGAFQFPDPADDGIPPEPPQRKPRNTGRKALATAGLQSGRVELPELPEIKRGTPKPNKKKA